MNSGRGSRSEERVPKSEKLTWNPFPSAPPDTWPEETQRSAYYSLFKDRGSEGQAPPQARSPGSDPRLRADAHSSSPHRPCQISNPRFSGTFCAFPGPFRTDARAPGRGRTCACPPAAGTRQGRSACPVAPRAPHRFSRRPALSAGAPPSGCPQTRPSAQSQ